MHVEPFGAEPMETLESVVQAREQGTWPRVLPADWPLGHLPKVSLDGAQVGRILHGQAIFITPAGVAADRVRLYDATGRFLGIGEADGTGMVKPRRLFNAES
jgi:tRNA pseudouridine55 synthase